MKLFYSRRVDEEFFYFHIPFCKALCDYCNFYKIPQTRGLDLKFYYERLLTYFKIVFEKEMIGKEYNKLNLYFGGGTPSDSFYFLEFLEQLLNFLEGWEVSIGELNLEISESTSLTWIKELIRLVVHKLNKLRISVGVQSFSSSVRRFIGRKRETNFELLEFLRQADLERVAINLDLIYVPYYAKFFLEDVEQIFYYFPDSVSVYWLEEKLDTVFFKKAKVSGFYAKRDMLENEDVFDIFFTGMKRLREKYAWYELSNLARSVKGVSLFNLNYWIGNKWIAFGAAASGFRLLEGKKSNLRALTFKSGNLDEFIKGIVKIDYLVKEEIVWWFLTNRLRLALWDKEDWKNALTQLEIKAQPLFYKLLKEFYTSFENRLLINSFATKLMENLKF